MNPSSVKHPSTVPLFISSFVTVAILIPFLFLIIGDLAAGAASGEPETGWGIAIAVILLGPPLLVSALINFLIFRNYRKAKNQMIQAKPVMPMQVNVSSNESVAVYEKQEINSGKKPMSKALIIIIILGLLMTSFLLLVAMRYYKQLI